jgi:acetyl esterase
VIVMTTTATGRVVLEQAAQEFVEATANPPFLYQVPVEQGRATVEQVQSGEGVEKPEIDEEWIKVEGGPTGSVPVRIVKPKGATGTLPVIIYIHGAGWVFGSANTHDRLVRELAVRSNAAVVFVEYDRAPEKKYPTQIEQNYAAAQWVVKHGAEKGLDASRVVVAGDSVGGNMSIVLALMAKERGDVELNGLLAFYPVTDASFDNGSYEQFATGYFLHREGMKWFWDQYTTDPEERANPHASPLRASAEQLRTLPPTLVITGEADVLRDEGEAFAAKLREAGGDVTAVRFGGIVHDFVMLDTLRNTNAAKGALELATSKLREWLKTSR